MQQQTLMWNNGVQPPWWQCSCKRNLKTREQGRHLWWWDVCLDSARQHTGTVQGCSKGKMIQSSAATHFVAFNKGKDAAPAFEYEKKGLAIMLCPTKNWNLGFMRQTVVKFLVDRQQRLAPVGNALLSAAAAVLPSSQSTGWWVSQSAAWW